MDDNVLSEPRFHRTIGSEAIWRRQPVRITHWLSANYVLATDLTSGVQVRAHVSELSEPARCDGASGRKLAETEDRELTGYSEAEWLVAQRRFNAIKGLLGTHVRTRSDVEAVAKREGVNVVTVYRWLRDYIDTGHLSVLVPARSGRKRGVRLLDPPVEKVIATAIEQAYLNKQQLVPQIVIHEVNRLCRLQGLAPPHPNSVRARLRALPPKLSLLRRGRPDDAANRYDPVRGAFPGADHPMAVLQIDHTDMDIIGVDDIHRRPVARPHITVALDVFSRMVAGLYISYDDPDAAAVGLCIAHAMCPKREYLAELGVAGHWPVHGPIGTVHCDNAKEFHSIAFERGCAEHHISIDRRPVKTPRYGGNVERVIGTLMRQLHTLPGTTFSNPARRKGYNSDKEAAMTLREIEAHVVDFIVNIYHQRVHRELGVPPIRKWEVGIIGDGETTGAGALRAPGDPAQIALDFMPVFERTVQRYGIKIDGLTYYDPVLDPFINATGEDDRRTKRKFIVKRDPREVTKIYFFDPIAKRYCVVPCLNRAHPPASAAEVNHARKMLREEGRNQVDEKTIFEAVERMRGRVEESTRKSKAARRQAERNPGQRGKSQNAATSPSTIAARFSPASSTFEEMWEDGDDGPVTPFDDVSESP